MRTRKAKTAGHDFVSLWRICQIYQTSPARVEDALAAEQITAAMRLNGQAFFDSDQIEKLKGHFKSR
jgi:hypothetical protein